MNFETNIGEFCGIWAKETCNIKAEHFHGYVFQITARPALLESIKDWPGMMAYLNEVATNQFRETLIEEKSEKASHDKY